MTFLTASYVCVCVYLDVGKVDAVEVGQHLTDLRGVLENGASCLRQMVERCVATQRLREGHHRAHLAGEEEEEEEV